MKWEKKGLILTPHGEQGLYNSHPTPLIKEKEGIIRMYVSFRPQQTLSMTTYVDLDINDLTKIVYAHPKPILELGERGLFDENGIMPASVIEHDGLVYLYYTGWQRSVGVPYNNYTGVAVSDDGGATFRKFSKGPVLGRTLYEVYTATSPCVLKHQGKWHAWYSSGTHWHLINDKLEHTYDIKYAVSDDGLHWLQTNETAIKQRDEFEAFTMPAIIEMGSRFHMWYSYRGSVGFRQGGRDSYKLGYAYSADLKNWTRADDQSGITLSDSGWDSEMMEYPSIISLNGDILMFYNGNGFGKKGFGYAKLVM